jgi:hypothetical protein
MGIINGEILVTIEYYNKSDNLVLFDFLDLESFSSFIEFTENEQVKDEDPSMLLFSNFKFSKRLSEGVYYALNKKNLSNLVKLFITVDDSSVIRFNIDLKGQDIRLFIENANNKLQEKGFAIKNNNNNNFANLKEFFPSQIGEVKKELVVQKVGQGSWNEFLYSGEPKLVFDIGTSYFESKKEVKKLISKRESDYQHSKPIIIISHWDVDHYHLLLEADEMTIKAISAFVYRSRIPNKTALRLLNRFKKLNPTIMYPIDEENPAPARTSDKLVKVWSFMNFSIYNGSVNRSRNKSGLLLTYININIGVVLAADSHHEQINNFVLIDFILNHDHYLVVPHHGGDAGKFIYNNFKGLNKDAIISVGKKHSYNHPLDSVRDGLKQRKFNIVNLKLRNENYCLLLT